MYATPLHYPPIVGALFGNDPGMIQELSKNEVAFIFGILNQKVGCLNSFISVC